VGHVARMGEGRGVYRVLVGRPEGKRPPGRASFNFSFNSVRKKTFFGCVSNQFCTAPMTSSSDENLLPLRTSLIGPNIWKLPQCHPLRFVCFPVPFFQWLEHCSQSLTLTALTAYRISSFFEVIYPQRDKQLSPF